MNDELIPTCIRLPKETVRLLSEAAALQQTTRTHLIRLSIGETLSRWLAVGRKEAIERLEATK
jgi:hypothetical protein